MFSIVKRFNTNKLKKISLDFLLNIVASFLLIGVIQVVIYPCLAVVFDTQTYGEILTIMGIINTIVVSFGNTLNNARLIVNSKYLQENLNGDFKILLLLGCFSSILISIFVFNYFFQKDFFELLFYSVLIVLGVVKSYLSVSYRLILNFKYLLYLSVLGSLGGCVGVVLLKYIELWLLPFILSELFQLIFCFYTSHIVFENFTKTSEFKETAIKYVMLITSGFCSNLLMYMDRLIIYPILGGVYVSYYNTASFFGKSLGLIMIPVAGVLLGYYAQKDFFMNKKKFWIINLLAIIVGIVFIIFSWITSPLITQILYPTLYDGAKDYIFIANVAATISVVANLTQTSVLKFAPTWLQIVKECVYGITYILGGYLLLETYGLYGFCFAAFLANLAKLFTLYIVGQIYID